MIQVVLIFLLVFSGAFSSQTRTNAPRRAMTITIDDLPYSNPAQQAYLPSAQRATDQILDGLKSHRAPAVGFMNVSFKDDPETPRWVMDLYNQR